MRHLHDPGCQAVQGLVDQCQEELLRLLVCQVQSELLLHLQQHLAELRALRYVLYACIPHQAQQVQNQIRRLAEPVVGLAAEGLEARVVLAVLPPHGVCHLSGEAEGRGHGLGVLAEDEAEVDVEHLPRGVDHNIVKVPVPYAQNVGDHTVAGAALHKSVQGAGGDLVGPCLVWAVVSQVVRYRVVVGLQHGRDGHGAAHELHQTVVLPHRQYPIGQQLEVEVDLLE
mmetsp:Transcript_14830/g.32735  ORF Transcript_14830/g.32735 Transcript_14830/m.32735 type:complete len:227 (-) Transcript_14830:779-1459(-)